MTHIPLLVNGGASLRQSDLAYEYMYVTAIASSLPSVTQCSEEIVSSSRTYKRSVSVSCLPHSLIPVSSCPSNIEHFKAALACVLHLDIWMHHTCWLRVFSCGVKCQVQVPWVMSRCSRWEQWSRYHFLIDMCWDALMRWIPRGTELALWMSVMRLLAFAFLPSVDSASENLKISIQNPLV